MGLEPRLADSKPSRLTTGPNHVSVADTVLLSLLLPLTPELTQSLRGTLDHLGQHPTWPARILCYHTLSPEHTSNWASLLQAPLCDHLREPFIWRQKPHGPKAQDYWAGGI